jgi:hypothetical protein
MNIRNTKVYGIEETIIRSGYPMLSEICEDISRELTEKDYKRAKHLGNAESGSGHDNMLKGIIVQADFEAPQYWWMQFQRYHFADIISSQSKMHRILKMDLDESCNEYVDRRIIGIVQEYIELYNSMPENSEARKKLFHKIISNVPMGLNLVAGVTTNYLQLKTIYLQRCKNPHRMYDWSIDFTNWCLELPMFKELCLDRQ